MAPFHDAHCVALRHCRHDFDPPQDGTPVGDASTRRPSPRGRGPGGHLPLGAEARPGGPAESPPAFGSIAAELEREAGGGEGTSSSGAAAPSGPLGEVDDACMDLGRAPSFADRPPTPSPPRPGSRGAAGAHDPARSTPPGGAEIDEDETDEDEEGDSKPPAIRRPPSRPTQAELAAVAAAEAADRRWQERRRPPLRASPREPPRAGEQQHAGGPPRLPPSPPSRHQQQASRPYPPPQQQEEYPHPSQYGQPPYGYPPPQAGGYMGGSPYGQGPPPPPPPGYYAPPPGSYYAPPGGYGPPPPGYGYPPPPQQHPGHSVMDRWPEEAYPPQPPPPPQGHEQQDRPRSSGSHQQQFSPRRGRERRPREAEGVGAGTPQPPQHPQREHRPEEEEPQGVRGATPTPGHGRRDVAPEPKSPLSKKRRAAMTPRTAATAASTPPKSTQGRPKRGDTDAAQTLLTVASPYRSPAPPSLRKRGHSQQQPERSPDAPQRSPASLPHTPGGPMPIGQAPTFTMDTPGGPGNLDPARLDEIFPSLGATASFGIEPGQFDSEDSGNGGMRFDAPQLGLSRSAESAEGMFGGPPPPHGAPMGREERRGSVEVGMGPERGGGPPGSVVRPNVQPMFRRRRGSAGAGGPDDDIIQESPFTSFMGELSPLPSHLQRSPMSSYGDSGGRDYYAGGRTPVGATAAPGSEGRRRGPPVPIPSLSAKGGGGEAGDADDRMAPHRRLKASPMSAPGSAARRRAEAQQALYRDERGAPHPHHASPGPFRLQLGGIGMKQTEARRGMEGINSALRGRPPPPHPHPTQPIPGGGETRGQSSHDYGRAIHGGYDYRGGVAAATAAAGGTPSAPYNTDFRTPIKAGASPSMPGSAARAPTPSGRPPTPSSHMAHAASHLSSAAKAYGGFPGETPLRQPGAAVATAGPGTGKENETPKRRHPCNCKKSKCLKLYCECFAAELYCEGCNCTDCSNTKEYEAIRSKAIRDTKAKNPNAFKARIAVKAGGGVSGVVTAGVTGSPLPVAAHNMGCRCKKSACLKKYCECFEAGVMCGSKCKCTDCLNYVGSQALIDRRRKIKDHRGAELAMRSADEAWKSGQQSGQKPPPPPPAGVAGRGTPVGGMPPHAAYPSPAHQPRMGPGHMPAPGPYPHHPHMGVPPPMIHPSPPAHHPGSMHYMPPHMMMGHHPHPHPPPPAMGYSPMSVQPTPPAYSVPRQRDAHSSGVPSSSRGGHSAPHMGAGGGSSASKKSGTMGGGGGGGIRGGRGSADPSPYAVPPTTPVAPPRLAASAAASSTAASAAPSSAAAATTPHRTPHRTPSRRLDFDPLGSKRRRRVPPGSEEPSGQFFGPNLPPQTKTAALGVFSFLSNDDLYNTSLVCRGWSKLSLDEELWDF